MGRAFCGGGLKTQRGAIADVNGHLPEVIDGVKGCMEVVCQSLLMNVVDDMLWANHIFTHGADANE